MAWSVEQVKLMGRLRRTIHTEDRLLLLYKECVKFDQNDSQTSLSHLHSELDSLRLEGPEPISFDDVKSNVETISSTSFNPSQTIPSTFEKVEENQSEREKQIVEYHQQIKTMTRSLLNVEKELNEKVIHLEKEKVNLILKHDHEVSSLKLEISKREEVIKERMNQIEELTEELKRSVNEREILLMERDKIENDLKKEIEENHMILKDLRSEFEQLNHKKQAIIDEKDFIQIQFHNLQEEKFTIDRNLQLTTEKMNSLKKKCDLNKQESSNLKQAIETLKQEKENKDAEITTLKRKLEMIQGEIEIYRKDLSEIQAKLAEEEMANEKAAKELNNLNYSLKEIEKSKNDLKKELKVIKSSKAQLESELQEKKLEIEELNTLIDKRTERESFLQQESNKDKSLLVELEAEKQTLRKENISINYRVSELEHLIKLEKNTTKKKDEEVKRLETVKHSLETKLNKAHEDIVALNKTIQENESQTKYIENKILLIQNEKKEIEEQLIKLNSVLRSCLKLGNVSISNESEITFDEIIPPKKRGTNLLSGVFDKELLDHEFVRSAIIDLVSKVESLNKENDDLKLNLDSSEKLIVSLKETNKNLKIRIEQLESEINQIEKENMLMSRKVEDAQSNIQKFEETIEKVKNEKKQLVCKINSLESAQEKLEKEKRKLLYELNSTKSAKLAGDKGLIEAKERLEAKLEKLEKAKESSDTQIAALIKKSNELTEEKEALQQEIRMMKDKLDGLQTHNYKLHSALNDSSMALKRFSDGEKELKKRVSNLADDIEQKENISKDTNRQIKSLKDQVQTLIADKSHIQSSLENERLALAKLRETTSQLQLKIRQLESELSLANIKRKEAEFQQTILTNVNIDKEAMIKDLKSEITTLSEKNKQLILNQKTMERSYGLGNINKSHSRSSEEVSKVTCFIDETNLSAKGLSELEEENAKLQDKVRDLEGLVNEAVGCSHGTITDLSRLKEAQKQAEELLKIREKSHKKHVIKLENDINILKGQISSADITSTPARFKISPCKGSNRERGQTSTPINLEKKSLHFQK